MDFSGMTLEEIEALVLEAKQEKENRDANALLIQRVTALVKEAKDRGFSKTQVANNLTKIVNDVYAA